MIPLAGRVLEYFFFQAEDGIRDLTVTGVQTCALPISIAQTEPALFIQDKWQIRPNLTLSYGLRWDAQIEPDPITAPGQVFFAPFIGKEIGRASCRERV